MVFWHTLKIYFQQKPPQYVSIEMSAEKETDANLWIEIILEIANHNGTGCEPRP